VTQQHNSYINYSSITATITVNQLQSINQLTNQLQLGLHQLLLINSAVNGDNNITINNISEIPAVVLVAWLQFHR